MTLKSLYVAATSQHVGKTTSTLGLAAAFKKEGLNTGYCKPVGQQHLEINGFSVDKDSVLFSDLLKIDIDPNLHSPIIIGKGATKKYLDNPQMFDLRSKIIEAKNKLEERHDLIIYEGTGHPGVGTVADLSNAQVAKMLGAHVVMVVEGGIGNTIDRLNLSLSLFRELEVPIFGVIINKVIPGKEEVIKHYVGGWIKQNNLNLIGLLPYDNTLAFPILWTIAKTINGVIEHNPEKGFNKVEKILAGSLVDLHELKKSQDNLLVVSSRAVGNAIARIEEISLQEGFNESPLSGIILTGKDPISKACQKYVMDNKIPLIRTDLDTYGAVIKISKLEVKINRQTPWKIAKAIDLVRENISTKKLISLLQNVTN